MKKFIFSLFLIASSLYAQTAKIDGLTTTAGFVPQQTQSTPPMGSGTIMQATMPGTIFQPSTTPLTVTKSIRNENEFASTDLVERVVPQKITFTPMIEGQAIMVAPAPVTVTIPAPDGKTIVSNNGVLSCVVPTSGGTSSNVTLVNGILTVNGTVFSDPVFKSISLNGTTPYSIGTPKTIAVPATASMTPGQVVTVTVTMLAVYGTNVAIGNFLTNPGSVFDPQIRVSATNTVVLTVKNVSTANASLPAVNFIAKVL